MSRQGHDKHVQTSNKRTLVLVWRGRDGERKARVCVYAPVASPNGETRNSCACAARSHGRAGAPHTKVSCSVLVRVLLGVGAAERTTQRRRGTLVQCQLVSHAIPATIVHGRQSQPMKTSQHQCAVALRAEGRAIRSGCPSRERFSSDFRKCTQHFVSTLMLTASTPLELLERMPLEQTRDPSRHSSILSHSTRHLTREQPPVTH
eukprot:scaffold198031_cov36-Tisochrysis_lutea.AAC.2